MSGMKDTLTVQIFTVNGPLQPIECDDVLLPITDSVDGSFSGSYGVRPGHAQAIFSLKEGLLQLSFQGKTVFSANVSDGFATIADNDLCITIERFNKI